MPRRGVAALSLATLLSLLQGGSSFTAHRPRWAASRSGAAAAAGEAAAGGFQSGVTCTGEKVVVVGASGYIGKAVVRESVRRGYPTVAVVRDARNAKDEPKFAGATVVETDVTDPAALAAFPAMAAGAVDVVISCLASRTGTKSDSFAIDYQATLNCLEAARAAGARHFVLLSAYCVKSAERRDPYALQFQYAKKQFEEKLQAATGDVSHSIVRPTAFFKSVSGQLEVVESGAPFVYFDLGGGRSATCNPISEADLAVALVDTIADPTRKDKVWNLGGPDEGLSMEAQGKMLHGVLKK
jgi:divinyl chlorophyllide a 8-vinyl-reductase